ncbi:MAG: T9SS type A sorting domain-containing protein [Bacteroidetes bacterium]|jgi:hypothetical protein|nr:T9SS type A sorting domain-containing protein [Bacteroidota bacterium]
MKKLLLLSVLLSVAYLGNAQFTPCLYDFGLEQLEQQFTGYQERSQQAIKKAVQQYRQRRGPNDEVFLIPVVVHVVWKEEAENISDERIAAQVRVLNESFRRQNADTVNTRPEFLAVAGDARVEFELVDVIRVPTDTTFKPEVSLFGGSTLPDHVKQSALGGSDAADPVNHLNIWVCALQPISILGTESPILGYAYPPAGLDNWPAETPIPELALEGVVVDYRTVGDNETYEVPQVGELPMLGRTMVHEVGHYLGLRHTSGDGALAALGVPDCEADDGVADTPNQGTQSQFNCDFMQNTCTDESDDLPDMVENYMDYSREDCQNSFTQGQIEIMRAVLTGPRAELPVLNISSSEEAFASRAIQIYPNPSSGRFRIQPSEPGRSVHYQYTVCDFLGRTVVPLSEGGQPLQLDLSAQPNGVYYLRFKEKESEQWLSQQLLKQ